MFFLLADVTLILVMLGILVLLCIYWGWKAIVSLVTGA